MSISDQHGSASTNGTDSTDGPQDTQTSGEEQERRTREKDPSDWVTGDQPATGAQLSYLSTLAREAGEPEPESPTKAEASIAIDELQDRTGRGTS